MTEKFIHRRQREVNSAQELLERIVKEEGYLMREILCNRRDRALVDQRQHIAMALSQHNYSYTIIGEVMNRDHTSIMHLCKIRR